MAQPAAVKVKKAPKPRTAKSPLDGKLKPRKEKAEGEAKVKAKPGPKAAVVGFGPSVRRKVDIASLVLGDETQLRDRIQKDVVQDYRDAAERGDKLPPIVVFHVVDKDAEQLVLADGHHRVSGYLDLDYRDCFADVYEGTLADAILYAAGANKQHNTGGLRTSFFDRRKAADKLLRHPKHKNLSNTAIADLVDLSKETIRQMKTAIEEEISASEARLPKAAREDAKINATVDRNGLSEGEEVKAKDNARDAAAQVPDLGDNGKVRMAEITMPKISDEQFLEGCKTRKKLAGKQLALFDEQALFWRHLHDLPSYAVFRHAAMQLIGAKSGLKDLGPSKGYANRFLAQDHPNSWKACVGCNGKGSVEGKQCKDCRTDGFKIFGR